MKKACVRLYRNAGSRYVNKQPPLWARKNIDVGGNKSQSNHSNPFEPAMEYKGKPSKTITLCMACYWDEVFLPKDNPSSTVTACVHKI